MSIIQKSNKSTIRANFVKEVLMGYEHAGHCPDQLLQQQGFKTLAQFGNTLLSVSDFQKLSIAIRDALTDEMLGFSIQPMPIGSMVFLNRVLTQLPTLEDAIDAISDFHQLFNDGKPAFSIESQRNSLRLHLERHTVLQSTSPYYVQRMLLGTYKQLCWLAKNKLELRTVALANPIHENLSELQYVFGCLNIKESAQCYIEFEENILQRTITQQKDGAAIFSEQSNLYTLLWPDLETLETKIRLLIGPDLSKGFPGAAQIAEQLNISPQTLSRWLHEKGSSYQNIKDNMRRETSLALLKNNNLSIKEVAFKAGYQESSAFSKAFKHWYGLSPTAYRETLIL